MRSAREDMVRGAIDTIAGRVLGPAAVARGRYPTLPLGYAL
jgi:hypothetical protein